MDYILSIEHTDASMDLSWANMLTTNRHVKGLVLTSKALCGQSFQNEIIHHADKIILHAGITGNGGTVYEQNVPLWIDSLKAVFTMIEHGLNPSHVVLRCDPIIPNHKCLPRTEAMLQSFAENPHGITRVHVGILDNYQHVQEQFKQSGVPTLYKGYWHAAQEDINRVVRMLDSIFRNTDICLECDTTSILSKTAKRLNVKPIVPAEYISETEEHILGIEKAKHESISNQTACTNHCLYCPHNEEK